MTGISSASNNFLHRLIKGQGKTYRNPLEPENEPQPVATGVPVPSKVEPPKQSDQQPEQPQSRYNFMQMFQPQPTPDVASEEVLKKRARMNALGRGLGAIGGLVGVAAGGDAPLLEDNVSPWILNQKQQLDDDHRRNLQDWVNKSFQVDQYNTGVANREIDQTIDAENRQSQIELAGQNARALAEQKAQADLAELRAKSEADQRKAIVGLGIDPNDPQAFEKYLNAKRTEFQTDLDYTKSQTARNYRDGKDNPDSMDVEAIRRGRNVKLDQLNQQLKQLQSGEFDPSKEGQIKFIQDQIKQISGYKPGANKMIDMDLLDLDPNRDGGSQDSEQTLPGASMQFDPSRGFTNIPGNKDKGVQVRIQSGLQRIASGDFENTDDVVQALVTAGEAKNEQEAIQLIEDFIQQINN